jgi:xylulokinase
MRRADLIGHLNTYLIRLMTGERVTDPSNASFMGLFSTLDQRGWSDELCSTVGVSPKLLPQIRPANEQGGTISREGARTFGLKEGTPAFTGCMDTSAAMLLVGAEPGQLLNVTGSTDVLALCTDRPRPHENLLTRALGVGKRWLSVSTQAAAGSALDWAHQIFFSEMPAKKFYGIVSKLADEIDDDDPAAPVHFENYLAGSRTSLEQPTASFTGLSLSTTREDMLRSLLQSLARESAARMKLLAKVNPIRIRRKVLLTGGVQGGLSHLLHRGWPGKWTFKDEQEATLRGVAALVP